MIDLLTDNMPAVIAASVAILSVLNALATSHPDDVRPGIRRVLLLLLDRLSAWQSKGTLGGSEPKLPVIEMSPRKEDLFR